ncbi:MAG: DUF4382 domain-containing protein [bacterium]
MKQLLYIFLLTFFISLFFVSCEDIDPGPAKVRFYLTDAPVAYDAINIDIQNIMINKANEEEPGWDSLDINETGIFNLLELNNGRDTLLGIIEYGGGTVSQIRLVLGNENTIVVNGETFPLTTPSGQQSGLKLNVNANFIEGETYNLWFDFDAARSIVETGSGKYILKPTIKVFSLATTGAIDGYVLPTDANARVYAIIDQDTTGAIPENDGYFVIIGLFPGQYEVLIDGADPYNNITYNSINVNRGVVTSTDTTKLQAIE